LNNLIIFDLDGVITSEEAYWDAAGLTLHELLYSPRYWGSDKNELSADGQYHPVTTALESRRISRAVFPESEILALKGRSINSNWDTCYVAVCLHLIDLLGLLPDCSTLLPFEPWDESWIAGFRELMENIGGNGDYAAETRSERSKRPFPAPYNPRFYADLAAVFENPIFHGFVGLELINRLDTFASEALGITIENVFSRYSPFWEFCRNIFQEWYLGEKLYAKIYGHAPAQSGKPGCIQYEKPLLPLEQIRASLETLREQGYVMGFATGRVYQEAAYPLKMYGLLEYFDEQHISTYNDVERAEAELRSQGDQTLLSKPNPFPFLIATDRNHTGKNKQSEGFLVVGDSTSDIQGGHAAGAITVAVMTGARTPEVRALLAQSNPDFTIEEVTKLPDLLEYLDGLATIQHMQFSEREKAERLLQRWFARHMNVKTESVTLTPKAVSLNSFNGFYRSDGEEYFFKTHIEEQGILEEYYHAEQLHQAGYNIVRPLRTIHEDGQQIVIYPVVRWPVMFDLMHAVEGGNAEEGSFEILVSTEKQECGRLLDIYRSTFASSKAEEHARASIHQLFWHRLVGGRFKSFYDGKVIPFPTNWECRGRSPLPGFGVSPKTSFPPPSPPAAASQRGRKKQEIPFKKVSRGEVTSIPFNELLKYRWVINGVSYQKTLDELVERAKVVLNPAQVALTIIGHGDAHFGNVFLENAERPQGPLHFNQHDEVADARPRYLYFDPAFAGRHSPLLDVIKPLFHNVFATWMYFPSEIAHDLQLTVSRDDMTIIVEHNYTLTPVRKEILRTKVEHLLRPLIAELRARDALPAIWKEIIQLALMCCPLLTINLLDGERMPPSICWLGLLLAIQTGNGGIQPWGYDL
jgi:phosphoglycolate phosphatase-like HAD superfamily hydrolase